MVGQSFLVLYQTSLHWWKFVRLIHQCLHLHSHFFCVLRCIFSSNIVFVGQSLFLNFLNGCREFIFVLIILWLLYPSLHFPLHIFQIFFLVKSTASVKPFSFQAPLSLFALVLLAILQISVNLVSKFFNPYLGGLFRGSFWVGGTPPPCLKFIRIMLETWNVAHKYTHTQFQKIYLLVPKPSYFCWWQYFFCKKSVSFGQISTFTQSNGVRSVLQILVLFSVFVR